MAMQGSTTRAAIVPSLTLLLAISLVPLARAQRKAPQVTFQVTSATSRMEMIEHTSRILTMQYKVPRVLVQNPEIVTATPISPTQVQISAQKPGVTHLNLWDEEGRVRTVDILISADGRELEQVLAVEFPDASLRVRPLKNAVVISGYVPSAQMVSRVQRMAEDYYPTVINNIEVGGVQTVLLHTKVIEVSRTKLEQCGVDWAYASTGFNGVSSVTGLLTSVGGTLATSGGETFAYTVVNGTRTLNSAIQLLQQKNLAKILAEPTLTTVSGRPASFQSGGEFPIPVPQQNGVTTLEFREFGTRVDYVPIVLGNGSIRLEVRPSVTEIDASRAVNLGGTTVPGLKTRWVDTAVEMKAGQTLALAGLIQTRTETFQRGIPILADMPILGIPFRRVSQETNEVEMLVMVTPEFVDGLDAHEVPHCLPGVNSLTPNCNELMCKSYMEVPNCRCLGSGCPHCQPGVQTVPMHHGAATAVETTPTHTLHNSPPIIAPPGSPNPAFDPTTMYRQQRLQLPNAAPQHLHPAATPVVVAPASAARYATPPPTQVSSRRSTNVKLPPILNPNHQYHLAEKPIPTHSQIRMPQTRKPATQPRPEAYPPAEPGLIGPVGYERVQSGQPAGR